MGTDNKIVSNQILNLPCFFSMYQVVRAPNIRVVGLLKSPRRLQENHQSPFSFSLSSFPTPVNACHMGNPA